MSSKFCPNRARSVLPAHLPTANFPLLRQTRSSFLLPFFLTYMGFFTSKDSWPGSVKIQALEATWEEWGLPPEWIKCPGINLVQEPGGRPPERGCGNQERWRHTGMLVQECRQRQGGKEKAKSGSQLSGFPTHFQKLEILTGGLFLKLYVHKIEENTHFLYWRIGGGGSQSQPVLGMLLSVI